MYNEGRVISIHAIRNFHLLRVYFILYGSDALFEEVDTASVNQRYETFKVRWE